MTQPDSPTVRFSAKRVPVSSIGALLLIGIVGCGSGSGSKDTAADGAASQKTAATPMPTPLPEVHVTLAHRSRTVRQSKVTISGAVDPRNALVRVEGRVVQLNGGRFARSVPLHLGSNGIGVEAQAADHVRFADSFRVTRRRSAAEIEVVRIAREKERIADERRVQARLDRLTQNFSGNGSLSIGTVRVEVESLLDWTNTEDPEFRQMLIYDKGFGMSVTSDAASGKTVVAPGTYRGITVAGGDWTITIRPKSG